MTKRFFLLSLMIIGLFGVTCPVFAAVISLPNPLCPTDAAGNPIDPAHCINSLPELIAAITSFVSTVIGSLAVVMFIWAGILFVTSAGNEGRLAQAKKAALYAVIGTGIALAGEGLVQVINAVIRG